MTVKEILKEKLNAVGDNVLRTYIAPDIPEKKLHNAAKIVAGGIAESDVIGFIDGTLLGSAKEGLVFTETTFYNRCNANGVISVDYKKIKKVKVEEDKLLVYDEVGVVYKETAIYNFRNLGELLLALANRDSVKEMPKTEEKTDSSNESVNNTEKKDAQPVILEDKTNEESEKQNISENLTKKAKNFAKSSFVKNNIGGLIVAIVMIVLSVGTNLSGSEDAFPIWTIIIGVPFSPIMGMLGWAIARKLRENFAPDVIFYTETSTLIFKKIWWGAGIYLLCSGIGSLLPMSIFQAIAQTVIGE